MFQKGQAPPPRRNFAIGGRERVRVSAYRIKFDDGTELELQGRYTSPGHGKLQALDYMDARNRKSEIASIEKIAVDSEMEKIRCARG
jgi:hypothetical protein